MAEPPADRGPLVSVVVPTYRGADRVSRLLDALEAQTFDRSLFEVVLVDDRSPEESFQRLRERAAASPLNLRLMRTDSNGGPARARNLGWQSTSAPFLAFTDDDCAPEAGWVEAGVDALTTDPALGVVQGRTMPPEGSVAADHAIVREVLGPSPWFEGCNLFFRLEALSSTPGFDEAIGWYGEDTAAGWAVVEAGWARGFADAAVVRHDVDDRGVRWRMVYGFRERRNLMAVAARHPAFRRAAFWRPWALRPEDVAATTAAAGLVLALKWPAALVLALPWLWWRRPPIGHPRPVRVRAETFAIDVANAAGVVVGALQNRLFVV